MSTTTPAAPAALQTEFSFELPIGYEDDEGRVHRSGAMRLARAREMFRQIWERRHGPGGGEVRHVG